MPSLTQSCCAPADATGSCPWCPASERRRCGPGQYGSVGAYHLGVAIQRPAVAVQARIARPSNARRAPRARCRRSRPDSPGIGGDYGSLRRIAGREHAAQPTFGGRQGERFFEPPSVRRFRRVKAVMNAALQQSRRTRRGSTAARRLFTRQRADVSFVRSRQRVCRESPPRRSDSSALRFVSAAVF